MDNVPHIPVRVDVTVLDDREPRRMPVGRVVLAPDGIRFDVVPEGCLKVWAVSE
jgi:hypothetical protein